MDCLPRTVDLELDELLPLAPAIAVNGPKGVGKTGTARRRAITTWLLGDENQRRITAADFGLTAVPSGTLLLDEWQKLPQMWDSVRRRVDSGAPSGSYLLIGFATPADTAGTHSGVGRILLLRIRPMALPERRRATPTMLLARFLESGRNPVGGDSRYRLTDYTDAIVTSGFPGTMSTPPRLRRGLLDAYLQRIIDCDLPDYGFAVRRPETLRRWPAAYIAASLTTASYSRMLDATTGGDGAQPTHTTTIVYRDPLTRLRILDPVPDWLPANNPIRRLQQAPKHQLADLALTARLPGLPSSSLLNASGTHMMGPLFESLAVLTVRVTTQVAETRVYHMRTQGGRHEMDLVVEEADGQIVGVEVKLAAAMGDSDAKHPIWLRDQIPDRVADLVVVTTGKAAYRHPDGVAVAPLALLGP